MEGDYLKNNTQNASSAAFSTTGPVAYVYGPAGFTAFQITLWSTIAFLGVVGNILVCLVILGRLRKTRMNYYLLSLAIADLGVLIGLYPMSVVKYISPHRWVLGRVVCSYVMPTEEIFFGASVWSITVIAVERYINIAGPRRYRFGQTSHLRTRLMIVGVWLLSFLVSSVPLYPIMNDKPICAPIWPTPVMSYTYLTSLIVVWYILPLAVIAFTYVKIRQRVRDSVAFHDRMVRNDGHTNSETSHSNRATARRMWRKNGKTRRILTPLVILFTVTMFPLNALRVFLFIKPEFVMNKYFNLVLGQIGLFVIVNSSANPLVYYITSREFKEAFKAVLASLKERIKVLNQYTLRAPSSLWSSRKSDERKGEQAATVHNTASKFQDKLPQ